MDHQAALSFNIPKRRTRISALMVDSLVITIAAIVDFKLWGTETENGYELEGWPAFLLYVFIFFYLLFPEMVTGRTLGKSLAGIKVISTSGKDASPKQIFLRHLVDIVDWMPGFFIVYFIVISNNEKRQRIGDMVAKTVVIQEKQYVS